MNIQELRRLYLREEKTTFCPGCGYEIFTNCFLKAVDELGKTLEDFTFTEGIGCSGWPISNYFKADNFHTTHGRAIAAATGIKLANPGLDVVMFGGDGDIASIGGNHLIHAARRNISIAVFCLNNFVYGMTGGQVGPTTPFGARTSTTPEGNPEKPFDLIRLVLATRGKFASRYPTVYPHLLIKGIKNILSGDGFRFMEVVSQCPRQYGQRNEMESASKMLKWQKEHYISKEKAKNLNPEKLRDKTIFGEFQSLKEYLNLLGEE